MALPPCSAISEFQNPWPSPRPPTGLSRNLAQGQDAGAQPALLNKRKRKLNTEGPVPHPLWALSAWG